MSHRPLLAISLLSVLAAILAAVPAAAQTFRLVDLGTLGGTQSCDA